MGKDSGSRLLDLALGGNRRALGRVISQIENGGPDVEAIVRQIHSRTGHAYAVGITGPPGGGKSTLTDELVREIREHDKTVAVIAVDPNSPFTGGAILGDRIRMMRHATDEGVFIRSMGARGHLGGLSLATGNVMMLLDAMGKDVLLVETVGVGQSELEIAEEADTTVLVVPPGLGDTVQTIKAGIMEIADIFVVSKSDNPHADRTVADIRELLRMEPAKRSWRPPIVKTIATRNEGIADLWIRIEQHRRHLEQSGELEKRRRARLERAVVEIAEDKVRRAVIAPRMDSAEFQRLIDAVAGRDMDPYQAADRLLTVAGLEATGG